MNTVRLSPKFQVVIPQKIREELGFQTGSNFMSSSIKIAESLFRLIDLELEIAMEAAQHPLPTALFLLRPENIKRSSGRKITILRGSWALNTSLKKEANYRL